jgi:hypothetical protein
MSKSVFDIEDASDGQTPEQYGGEVNLDELKPSSRRDWDIGPPDPRNPVTPVEGGTVEIIQGRCRIVIESPARRAVDARRLSWELTDTLIHLVPTVILIVLVFLGFGFVTVVTHDIEQNKLDLKTYVEVLGWIAGGLLSVAGGGFLLQRRSDRARRGDGSG